MGGSYLFISNCCCNKWLVRTPTTAQPRPVSPPAETRSNNLNSTRSYLCEFKAATTVNNKIFISGNEQTFFVNSRIGLLYSKEICYFEPLKPIITTLNTSYD